MATIGKNACYLLHDIKNALTGIVSCVEVIKHEDIEPDEIEVDMALEVKGVPSDINYNVVVADKVSFEEE